MITHVVTSTGLDDEQKAEKAETFGIELKPEVNPVARLTESTPQELEEIESPDTISGQPEGVPPTADPPVPPLPPPAESPTLPPLRSLPEQE